MAESQEEALLEQYLSHLYQIGLWEKSHDPVYAFQKTLEDMRHWIRERKFKSVAIG